MKNLVMSVFTLVVLLGAMPNTKADELVSVDQLSNTVESIEVREVEFDALKKEIKRLCKASADCSRKDRKALIKAVKELKEGEELQMTSSEPRPGTLAAHPVFVTLRKAFNKAGRAVVIATKFVLKTGKDAGLAIADGTVKATKWVLKTGKKVGLAIAGATVDGVKFTLKVGKQIGLTIAKTAVRVTQFTLKLGKKVGTVVAENVVKATKFVLRVGKVTGLIIKESVLKATRFVLKTGKRFGLAVARVTVKAVKAVGRAAKQSVQFVQKRYRRGQLLLAARTGNLDRVRKFVEEKNTDVTLTNRRGINALMFAARYGRTDVVEYLLARMTPAQLKVSDWRRRTARDHARLKGHDGITKLIDAKLKAAAPELAVAN